MSVSTRAESIPAQRSRRRQGTGDQDAKDAAAESALRRLRSLPEHDPRAERLRAYVVTVYEPLIGRIARRYSGRGEPYEDLRQTAMVGLVKAIHGFDPDRGKPFVSYLLPMVTGEIKRHFRDHTWAVRVPRRHQENRARLRAAVGEFQQLHARTPTVPELARCLELSPEDVTELVQVNMAYRTLSLDAPDTRRTDGEEGSLLEDHHLGQEDKALERAIERESLRPALERLPERERRLLKLRFFGDKTQSEIAKELGYSQMHVSRLLAAVLDRLREEMDEQTPDSG